MAAAQRPEIKWDGKKWFVSLPINQVIEASFPSDTTYVCKIRECDSDEWSVGFETPLMHCTFTDLKPDTEYEVQVRAKNAVGIGKPAYFRLRTDAEGHSGNVIPFPDPESR